MLTNDILLRNLATRDSLENSTYKLLGFIIVPFLIWFNSQSSATIKQLRDDVVNHFVKIHHFFAAIVRLRKRSLINISNSYRNNLLKTK
jgi:hypothetical protein